MPRSLMLPDEVQRELRALDGVALRARVRELVAAGWPQAALAHALDRPRSTISFWVSSIPSASSADSTITAAEKLNSGKANSVPLPPPRRPRYVPERKNVTLSSSPGLSEVDKRRIKLLSLDARRYRASTRDDSPQATATEELTELINDLYSRGVTVREIADAAGVTYRTINRRIRR